MKRKIYFFLLIVHDLNFKSNFCILNYRQNNNIRLMQYNLSLLGDGLRRCKGEKENSSWFEIRNENEEVFCFIISRQYLICNSEQILSDIRYTDFSFWLKSQATISALFLFLTLILLQIPLRFWQSYFPCSYYFICHPKYYNGRNNFWIPNFIISSIKLKCWYIGKITHF